MNANPDNQFPGNQARQFCEQCGTLLGVSVNFCESCGRPVPDLGENHGDKSPSSVSRRAKGKWGIMVAGVLSLVLIIGASRWWPGREHGTSSPANPGPAVAARQEIDPAAPLADLGEEKAFVEAAHQSDLKESEQKEPSQPAPAATPLTAWLEEQAWFLTLGKSMPDGVSLSVMFPESEDLEWEMVEIREVHSPESGFDPAVSPMVGIFRVSADRQTTEWLDPVVGEWDSIRVFPRGMAARDFQTAPVARVMADATVRTPAPGSPERTAICDAMRDHIIRDNRDRALPEFLFVVDFIRVSGDYAGFQGYPVKPDGTPQPDGLFEDIVHSTLLENVDGVWRVVLDLSRTDVPTDEEVRELRDLIPAGFPADVIPDFWRDLLKS